jgi:2-iminobutanoate/2-iminopropanoate deaminase
VTVRLPGSEGAPYVPGVVAEGRFVFVSGQTPRRDGAIEDETMGGQTRAAMQNLADVLASAGASLDDVVRCGVFVGDLDRLPEFNEAYVEAFSGTVPARTAVGALLPGYLVEIDCIAVLPAG